MRRWIPVAFTILALAVPLVAGCGGNGAVGEGAAGALIINNPLPATTLDPHRVETNADIGLMWALYSTLLRYDQKPISGAPPGVDATREDQEKLLPYLAESYDVSTDGRTFTFKLRSGVKFATGRPVDSAAVKASFERAVKVNAGSSYYARIGQPDLDVRFEAPDPSTFVVRIARREVLMLHAFAQPHLSVVDVAEIGAHGGDGEDLPAESNQWIATHAAGAGPYLLKEYTPGDRLVLEANPTFFAESPREKTVIINFIESESTLHLQARNGAAHVTYGLSKETIKDLEGNPCCNIVKVPTHTQVYISLPMNVPPFDNRKFREALTYAVPYEDILEEVAAGYGHTGFYGPFAPEMPGFNPEVATPRAFNLDKARALIEESGVPVPVNADVMVLAAEAPGPQIATIVQDVWRRLGVNLTIKSMPASAYYSQDGIFLANKAPVVRRDGPGVLSPLFQSDYDIRCETTPGNTNWTNVADFCSEEVEALLNEAHRAQGNLQRYWDEIAKIYAAASPRIPIYAEDFTVVLDKSVKRWTYKQMGTPFELATWEH